MSFFNINGIGLAISAIGGVQSVDLSAPPASTVTPALTVGYVDTSGARHWDAVTDNVTTITGVAPFPVDFTGYGSVSEQSDSNTAQTAFMNLGALIDYGEAVGGNWSLSGRPRDTDRGMPMCAHTYTVPGTYSARMTLRDSAGNQNFIRVNVVVTAPGAGVAMTNGVLPTFASDTVYNAPAGGTWPNITSQLNGLHNVIIRKSGAGADPIFGTVTLDGRNEPDSVITRTRGVRFLNCDVANVTHGNVGIDYCAFVGGRVRQITMPPMQDAANQIVVQNRTAQQAANVRYARGLFLQDTGDMIDSDADGYVFIGAMRGLHLKNVRCLATTSAQTNARGIFAFSSMRHTIFTNTAAKVGYNKWQGEEATLNYVPGSNRGTPDAWNDTDDAMVFVSVGNGRTFGLPATQHAVVDCQYGESGSVVPTANGGWGPENNDAGDPAMGCELSAMEHCKWFQPAAPANIDISGRWLATRDCRIDNGAGAAVGVNAGTVHPNRTPIGWEGPYYTTGSRPVVVP